MNIEPIATIKTPYAEKFGVPRQPGLVNSARAYIEFLPPYDDPDALRGIEKCSHLWLIFHFSETANAGWKALTRPPRLGGNEKLGVFATRSTHRPNALGLSAVKLVSVEQDNGKTRLVVTGADLVDGTPIIDIKPYIPYADKIDDADYPGMDQPELLHLHIDYQPAALESLAAMQSKESSELVQLIKEVLLQDPRPAYQRDPDRIYGVGLNEHNVRFQILDTHIEVIDIKQLSK